MGMSEYSGDGRIRPEDTRCLLDRARLELQLGDEAAALAGVRRLVTFYSRDPMDLVVRRRAQELLGSCVAQTRGCRSIGRFDGSYGVGFRCAAWFAPRVASSSASSRSKTTASGSRPRP